MEVKVLNVKMEDLQKRSVNVCEYQEVTVTGRHPVVESIVGGFLLETWGGRRERR